MFDSTTWMCTACGWLELPADVAWNGGDPLRSEAGTDPRTKPCRHCGACEWADLGDATTITALRHVDLAEAPTRASFAERELRRLWAVSRGIGGIVIAVALVVGLVTSTVARGGLVIMLYPALVGLSIVVVATVVDAAREVRAVRPARLPVRWRLALPADRSPSEPACGLATAVGPLLRAPLTERPCIAYELGIRTDKDGGAPESTWLLLEQRSTAFVVGEQRHAPDSVRLELARERVELDALDEDRVGAIVRTRGFLTTDTTLALFETIIPDGATLDVRPAQVATGPSRRERALSCVRLSRVMPALRAGGGERA